MELTTVTTMFGAGNAPLFTRAAAQACATDHAAIDNLCRQLTGIEGEDSDEIADALICVPMPRGFLHVRVFDADDGVELSAVLSTDGRPITADEVSLLVTQTGRFEEARWVGTSPLPVRDPGVLDLLVRFEPRS